MSICSATTTIDERLPFQLYSDLHLGLIEDPFGFPRFERHKDILVLAGDIGHISSATFRNFMNYCSLLWDHVVFVPGNREFYSESKTPDSLSVCDATRKQKTLKTYAHLYSEYVKYFNEFSNVYFFNCDALEFGHFVLFGATMWSPIQPKWDDGRQRIQGFDQPSESWEHMLALKAFLERQDIPDSKKVYVVTHFPIVRAPERVVSEEYLVQPADKMRYFMCGWRNCFPSAWTRKITAVCSGHTHHPFDFVFKGVRNVSNPRGFPNEVAEGFKPDGVF